VVSAETKILRSGGYEGKNLQGKGDYFEQTFFLARFFLLDDFNVYNRGSFWNVEFTEMSKTYFEQQEQIAVSNFIKTLRPSILFTINAYVGTNRKIGAKMKAAGYDAGCPDIMIFEPRNGFLGLLIELKRSPVYGNSKVSDEQKRWIVELNKRGYKCVVCFGAQEAYKAIEGYFRNENKA
jgi:hypothetical protein